MGGEKYIYVFAIGLPYWHLGRDARLPTPHTGQGPGPGPKPRSWAEALGAEGGILLVQHSRLGNYQTFF
jgi:hypothetical protein